MANPVERQAGMAPPLPTWKKAAAPLGQSVPDPCLFVSFRSHPSASVNPGYC